MPIKILICVLCIAAICVLVTVCSKFVFLGFSAPTEPKKVTEVGATENADGTETTEPSGTDGTETVEPDPTEDPAEEKIPTEDNTVTEAPHSHSYTSAVTKEATCTEKGVKTYTCACGDSYTEAIDKLDHKYTSETVKPTCTTKGYTVYTCACGKSYQDKETKATGHSWGDWSEAEEGKSTRECKTCGKKETKTESDNNSSNPTGNTGCAINPNGDPNGTNATFVAPADPATGISWDGVSPIIYTYTDGTTGTEPKLGATYYVTRYRVATVNEYTLGLKSIEDDFGGASDGTCRVCGKQMGDGTDGTCVRWLAGDVHTCEHCGEEVPGHTCHTCPEY